MILAQDYLSAFCFGDFYTRDGLVSALSVIGGAERQVKAHVQGNKNVGNDKQTLIAAITHCLPYIRFPRTINALSCVNEIIPNA